MTFRIASLSHFFPALSSPPSPVFSHPLIPTSLVTSLLFLPALVPLCDFGLPIKSLSPYLPRHPPCLASPPPLPRPPASSPLYLPRHASHTLQPCFPQCNQRSYWFQPGFTPLQKSSHPLQSQLEVTRSLQHKEGIGGGAVGTGTEACIWIRRKVLGREFCCTVDAWISGRGGGLDSVSDEQVAGGVAGANLGE